MKVLIAFVCATLICSGCVTEAQHTRPVKLPDGTAGYEIICNSTHYDRCLNRAAKACGGPYTILPEFRSSTLRTGDKMPGVGNSESITVTCGKQ